MYNELQKAKYLDSISTDFNDGTVKSTHYMLKKASKVEELLNKDICEFCYADFKMLFEHCRYIDISTFRSHKSNFIRYVKWCAENKLGEYNAVSELERLRLEDVQSCSAAKMYNECFADIDDLLDGFEEAIQDGDEIYRYMFSVFYGLCWYGFSDEELYYLKKDNFNSADSTVESNGRKIKVSERFSQILKKYIAADEIIMYSQGDERCFQFVKTEYLIRNTIRNESSARISENYISARSKKWKKAVEELPIDSKYYGKKLTPTKTRASGAYYRLLQKEKSGIKVNINNIESLIPEYDLRAMPQKRSFTLSNYNLWKSVFGYSDNN